MSDQCENVNLHLEQAGRGWPGGRGEVAMGGQGRRFRFNLQVQAQVQMQGWGKHFTSSSTGMVDRLKGTTRELGVSRNS